jgi:hypothetical protein
MTSRPTNVIRPKRPTLAMEVRHLRALVERLRGRVSVLEGELDDLRDEVTGIDTADLEARLDEVETAAAVRAGG